MPCIRMQLLYYGLVSFCKSCLIFVFILGQRYKIDTDFLKYRELDQVRNGYISVLPSSEDSVCLNLLRWGQIDTFITDKKLTCKDNRAPSSSQHDIDHYCLQTWTVMLRPYRWPWSTTIAMVNGPLTSLASTDIAMDPRRTYVRRVRPQQQIFRVLRSHGIVIGTMRNEKRTCT